MENKNNSFILYKNMQSDLEDLTLEQKGLVLNAIFNYQNEKEYLTNDNFVNFVLKQYIKTFKRDKEKWDAIKKKRSEAGKKGGRPPKNKEKEIDNVISNVDETMEEVSKVKKELKKKNYGEFKNVKLTDDEYLKVKELYIDSFDEAIEILDDYIEQNGKKYKSHYAVFKKNGWIYKRIEEDIKKSGKIINDPNDIRTWDIDTSDF